MTKKAIKAAPQYMVTIDYTAGYKPGTIEGKLLKAKTLIDAMNEATELFVEGEVWCLSLYEKTSEVDEIAGTGILYKEILRSDYQEQWRPMRNGEVIFYWAYNPELDYTVCIKHERLAR